MSRIWIDVEDLFAYASAFRRPSGIQRTVFELCQALVALDPKGIGLLRHAGRHGFAAVPWHAVAKLFNDMATTPPAPGRSRTAWQLQGDALRALLDIPRGLWPAGTTATASPAFTPGDVLFVAGAGWDDPTHAARLIATKRRHGLRLAVLVYDLIPLRRPEWCDRQTAARFGRWIDALLAEADDLLSISAATAGDVAARRARLELGSLPARVIRLGDGFSADTTMATPIEGDYALFVATLEIRKNHALLVAAWRMLLDRLGADRVPKLVFAGREGPLVGDLLSSLRAEAMLDGHVILRADAGDAELAALYRGCRFTVFPSLYEGWGLPVAESLCFGKPCLASNATSVPEVGGDLVRYFDPMDLADTVRVLEAVVGDPRSLVPWEAAIRTGFRPTPWSASAAAIRGALSESVVQVADAARA